MTDRLIDWLNQRHCVT